MHAIRYINNEGQNGHDDECYERANVFQLR